MWLRNLTSQAVLQVQDSSLDYIYIDARQAQGKWVWRNARPQMTFDRAGLLKFWQAERYRAIKWNTLSSPQLSVGWVWWAVTMLTPASGLRRLRRAD